MTWVIQVMPVFFMVGGYANALSWRSARRRGEGMPRGCVRACVASAPRDPAPDRVAGHRLDRAYAAGVPGGTLRTASRVALVPTWFLAAYVMVVALAPAALALGNDWGGGPWPGSCCWVAWWTS